MRATARLAAETANTLKLYLFPSRLGAARCCSTIAGSEGSQGLAVTAGGSRQAQLRSGWQLSMSATVRSFHSSIPSRSDAPEKPPKAQAAASGSPSAEQSTTAGAVSQADEEAGASDEGMFHMPDHLEDAELEGQDLAIMDVAGSRPPKPKLVEAYLSQEHFSAAEQYKWRKHELITELQEYEHDTGTMPVQIGLLSERISYLTKHTLVHRKDHAGRRGLLILLSRRRKILKYLRKKDFDAYVKVLRRFGLKDNYYQSGWGEQYRVGTNLKWTPDQTDKQTLPDPDELRQRLLSKLKQRRIKTFRVGSKVLTKPNQKKHERSQQIIKNRVMALNEGWEKKQVDAHNWSWEVNEDKDYWQKRLKSVKEYMPEELNKPEFELQRLAAAAQRNELDEEGMQGLKKLRAETRQKKRQQQREEQEKLRSSVLAKYGSPRGGAKMDTWGARV